MGPSLQATADTEHERPTAGLAPERDLAPGPEHDLRGRARPAPAAVPPGALLVDERYDQRVRWTPGERLHELFEAVCDRLRAAGAADRVAVCLPEADITYDELDARANALARHLLARGIRPGDRVGLLFDAALPSYVALLATLKVHAAYVPLDAGFPPDRIAYIAGDAQLSTVLTHSHLSDCVDALDPGSCPVTYLDEAEQAIAARSGERLTPAEVGQPVEELCYVIYTSGSTGVPKGVPIEHASICNFVRVADEIYGVRDSDRMYQGMTIAFDFSVEEIWTAWMAGATLVPKPGRTALVGVDLRDYLIEQRITAMSCVPTLLATIEEDVPHLRFILVSGEACPQDLIARWWRPDRRFLNVYGPTEATVTATWTPLHPDEPVTIGVPLPTYSALILDPDVTTVLPRGATGEVALAGIALSPGYLNRPDQTARAFVPDTLLIPNNPSGLIYRTGDLGRIDEHGRIEYLGRIDTQVKIRGYRIELTEIESVLLQAPGVAAAVVEPYSPEPGVVELVAYLVARRDCPTLDVGVIIGSLRDRLPGYMIPAYVEQLDALPLLPSDKVDRKRLPPPTAPRHTVDASQIVPPEGALEQSLAAELATVLALPQVSVVAHVIDELGATSIRMSTWCARLRAHAGLEGLRIADLYQHPTVRDLAVHLAERARRSGDDTDEARLVAGASARRSYPRVSTLRWTLCGLYQAAVLLALPALLMVYAVPATHWMVEAPTYLETYLRSVAVGAALFVALTLLPVLAKWTLVGRWRAGEFPAWGRRYLRWWTVRTLLVLNPMRLFAGSPLLSIYLRMLGARIGPRVLWQSSSLPLATDLVSVGADTVVSKGALVSAYRIDAGWVRLGPVRLGSGVYVGGRSVLDVDTHMGDGSELGHASALLPGQAVPSGRSWHGVPARPTTTVFRRGPALPQRWYRPVLFSVGQLAVLLLGPLPIGFSLIVHTAEALTPGLLQALLGIHDVPWNLAMYEVLVAATLATFVVGIPGVLAIVWTVPRLVARFLRPGVAYPVYGLAYVVQRFVSRLSNLPRFVSLFGDSSYCVGYLSRLGYRLRPVVQTGSNFGLAVDHDIPTQCRVGPGTIASDGLHFSNTDFTSTGFVVSPAVLGAGTFVGNTVHVPTGARLGDDVLLATKVAVPLDGPMRTGVGLLGSPCFEIPLRVGGDGVPPIGSSSDREAGLRRKNRANRASIAVRLGSDLLIATVAVLILQWAFALSHRHGLWVGALVIAPVPWLLIWWSVLVERAALGFDRLRSRHATLYHPHFWTHERYWKLSLTAALGLFDATPFKAWFLRALGLTVGRRLLDDGCYVVERTMIRIGDDATLGHQSVLQCHSLENSVFRSAPVLLGSGATIGARAFVHYGTRVGRRATLETDSFLMKGEQMPADARWVGNPAGPA